MIKNRETFFIRQIIQALLKYKTVLILSYINLKIIHFINFLWKNHFLYGYSAFFSEKNNKNIVLFLKNDSIGNFFEYIVRKKNYTFQNLRKKITWSKNTFFILSSKKGFLNKQQVIFEKIGGFLLTKIF